MTKMAATPMYFKKTFKMLPPEPQGHWHWGLVSSTGDIGPIKLKKNKQKQKKKKKKKKQQQQQKKPLVYLDLFNGKIKFFYIGSYRQNFKILLV